MSLVITFLHTSFSMNWLDSLSKAQSNFDEMIIVVGTARDTGSLCYGGNGVFTDGKSEIAFGQTVEI